MVSVRVSLSVGVSVRVRSLARVRIRVVIKVTVEVEVEVKVRVSRVPSFVCSFYSINPDSDSVGDPNPNILIEVSVTKVRMHLTSYL